MMVLSAPKKIRLYNPTDLERVIDEDTHRFRVVNAGRRWGKTDLDINEIVKYAWEDGRYPAWWVSKTKAQTARAYRLIQKHFSEAIDENHKNEKRIMLQSGGTIEFKSAEAGDALRGEGIGFMIVDEAAFIDKETWENCLRPSLSDTKGHAILSSTPKGRNYYWHLYLRGQDPEFPEWKSWSLPAWTNPYMDPGEIEEARKTLPDDVFRQEYGAEFLEEAAGVFHNVQNCITGTWEEPLEGHQYFVGWDPAKHQDFSVIYVIDSASHHLVYQWRASNLDYSLQVTRFVDICKRYNWASGLLDCTGVGDAILEQAKKEGFGLKIEGYVFTQQSKQQLIETLVVALEQRDATFPHCPELEGELSSFEYELTRAGNIRYAAVEGEHDDTVCAFALVYWHMRQNQFLGGFNNL